MDKIKMIKIMVEEAEKNNLTVSEKDFRMALNDAKVFLNEIGTMMLDKGVNITYEEMKKRLEQKLNPQEKQPTESQESKISREQEAKERDAKEIERIKSEIKNL